MFPSAAVTQLDPEVPEMKQGKTRIPDTLSCDGISHKQKSTHCSLLREYSGAQFVTTEVDGLEKETGSEI